MPPRTPPELRAIDRARSRVDKQRDALAAAILDRNAAIETAKQAGYPAAEVYRRAGIHESTASRARAKREHDGNDAPA